MQSDITPILSKIKKLLALSTSSNPNEAALAAAKAQELLMQHNLTMSQVQTQEPSSYERSTVQTGKRVWRRLLLTTIAQNNFCESIYNVTQHISVLIGETHNIEVVTYLYQYLIGQLEPMAVAAHQRSIAPVHGKTWFDSFYMGAVNSIHERLEAQKREMEAASNDCRALVVSKDAELKTAVMKFFPNVRNGGTKRVRSADGYFEGVEAGNRVALNKAIEA